jgi:hypothetical protein
MDATTREVRLSGDMIMTYHRQAAVMEERAGQAWGCPHGSVGRRARRCGGLLQGVAGQVGQLHALELEHSASTTLRLGRVERDSTPWE